MKFKFLTSLFILSLGALLSYGGYRFASEQTHRYYQFEFKTFIENQSVALKKEISLLESQLLSLAQFSEKATQPELEEAFQPLSQGSIHRLILVEQLNQKALRSFQKKEKRSNPQFEVWPKAEGDSAEGKKANLLVIKKEWINQGKKSLVGLNLLSNAAWQEQQEKLQERKHFASYQKQAAPFNFGAKGPLFIIPVEGSSNQWFIVEVIAEKALIHLSDVFEKAFKDFDTEVNDAKGNVPVSFSSTFYLSGYEGETSFRLFELHYGIKYKAYNSFIPDEKQNLPFIIVTVIFLSFLLLLSYFLYLVAKFQEEARIRESRDKLAKFYEASIQASQSAGNIEEMLQIVIRQISDYAGWPIGHIYLPDVLKQSAQSDIWYFREEETYGFFKIHYESPNFMTGESLIDRALAHEQSVWINNIALDGQFTKSKVRKDMGVGAAIGLPLWINNEVTAVLEFFAAEALETDETLLFEVEQVVRHLGEYIERHWAKDQIQTSLDLNRKVLDAIHEAVVVLGKKGEIRMMNLIAEQMFGYLEKDIKGMGVELLIGTPFNMELKKAFQDYHDTGHLLNLGGRKGIQAKKKGGSLFESQIHLQEVRVKEDALVVATFGSAGLAEQPKVDPIFSQPATSAFNSATSAAGNLSFYSQQPITGEDTTLFAVSDQIQKSLGGLLAQKLPKQIQKDLRAVSYSTQELHEALECLMDLSRFEKGDQSLEKLHFNLMDMLNQVLEEVGPRVYAQGLELITELHGNIPEDFIGDPAKISLCLKMMVTNALQYTTSGHLSLTVKCQMSDRSQAKLMFIVQDTGCGVDERRLQEIRVQLFEKGRQTKKSHAIGLTLTYAKNLAELLQGGINLSSAGQGEGAEMALTLLLPRQRKEEKDLILKKNLGGEKLLLLSENKAVSTALRSRLVYNGAEVFETGDLSRLEEVFTTAYEQGDPFGWVLINAPASPAKLADLLQRYQQVQKHSRLILFVAPYQVVPEVEGAVVVTKPISAKEPNLIMEDILNQELGQ